MSDQTPRMPNFWWSPTNHLYRGGDKRPCADAVRLVPESAEHQPTQDSEPESSRQPTADIQAAVARGFDALVAAADKAMNERDELQARINSALRWLDDPQDLTLAGQLHQIRAALLTS